MDLADEEENAPSGLRRAVTTWQSFSWGYADVGADVYVALGLVALYAHGATPLAFLLCGFIYLCVGLAYTELASAYPVAGGSQYYTLRGLGDFCGFVSGWALILAFTLDIALFGLITTGYINYFLPDWVGKQPWWALETAIFVIIPLTLINILGMRESSTLNGLLSGIDIIRETGMLFIGFVFAFHPDLLHTEFMGALNQLKTDPVFTKSFLYGTSIAVVSYIGLESISQAAQETVRPATIVPRTSLALIFTVLIYTLGFSTLALGMEPRLNEAGELAPVWSLLAENKENAVAVLMEGLPGIGRYAAPITAIFGAILLLASTNTGVMGSSRIAWSMANFQMLPKWLGSVQRRFRTPHWAILACSAMGLVELCVASFGRGKTMEILATMYAFAALSGYTLVLISLVKLRLTDPYTPRPFRMWLNIPIQIGRKKIYFPILGTLGILGSIAILTNLAINPETPRLALVTAPLWLIIGMILYLWVRRRMNLPLFGSVPHDWEKEQKQVLREAEEFQLLRQYLEALEERDADQMDTKDKQ